MAGIKVTTYMQFTILTVLTLFLLWAPAIQVVINEDSQQHQQSREEIEVDVTYTSAATTGSAPSDTDIPNHVNLLTNVTMISVSKDLGDLGFSGLTNQRCMLFGVVNQAIKLGAVLDVSSIRYRGAWNESSSLSHEELYDVAYWNRYATDHPNSLPLLVRGPNARSMERDGIGAVHGFGTSTSIRVKQVAYAAIRLELSLVDSSIMKESRLKELARHFYLALRPSRDVQDIIDELQPRGDYGAIHMRIEEDLKSAAGFWERRLTVRKVFDRLRASTDVTACVEKYSSQATGPVMIYVAVGIDDVNDADDLGLLRRAEGPWPGSLLVFDSTKEKAKKKYGTRAGIVSSLADFEISRRATLFAAGHFELSTFSRAIGDTRIVVDETDDGSFEFNLECRRLFFDYSSNRTLQELFRQQPTPQFRPKAVKWEKWPVNADKLGLIRLEKGIGYMVLQQVIT